MSLRPLSNAPSAREVLETTMDHHREKRMDTACDLRDQGTVDRLVAVLHKDAYDEFETFLLSAGLSQPEAVEFRMAVFQELLNQKYITDPENALLMAISLVFTKYFDNIRLVEMVKSLEQDYYALLPEEMPQDASRVTSAILTVPIIINKILELARGCK